MRTLTTLAVLLAPLTLSGCMQDTREAGPVVYFSAIPDDNRSGLQARYDLVAQALSDELGVRFTYKPSTDYEASVEAFKNGDVLLAWFGGVSGVRARLAVPGAQAIAQGRVDPQFRTYFIAHQDLGLEFSADFPMALRGESFTFGSRGSTSGRLMPQHFITQETGQGPEEFFGHPPQFSAGHDQTALQVQAGSFAAGALNYKTYERMVGEGTIDPKVCRHIWTTPPYADYNWTAHPALNQLHGEGFVEQLQAALVALDDPAVLRALDRAEGLIPADNAAYDAIEATMRQTGLLR
ncbi:MAG: putative selenate ABC transporter substrate-binding protein [Planctomycetaceae bacterium]|nr:putative selenate ABC transporter substrate-binding protein [Planctomycetaceae bacterium]